MSKILLAYGRYNPPTKGHQLVFSTLKEMSLRLDLPYQVWVSHSFDKKNNPLPLDMKLYYLGKMFGDIVFRNTSKQCSGIIPILTELNTQYNEVCLVVGSDRKEVFTHLLAEYNGVEYNYNTIEVLSCGDRDNTNELSRISASLVRDAVKDRDFNLFVSLVSDDIELCKEMYQDMVHLGEL